MYKPEDIQFLINDAIATHSCFRPDEYEGEDVQVFVKTSVRELWGLLEKDESNNDFLYMAMASLSRHAGQTLRKWRMRSEYTQNHSESQRLERDLLQCIVDISRRGIFRFIHGFPGLEDVELPQLLHDMIHGLRALEEHFQVVRTIESLVYTDCITAESRPMITSVALFAGLPSLRRMHRWDLLKECCDLLDENGNGPSIMKRLDEYLRKFYNDRPLKTTGQDDPTQHARHERQVAIRMLSPMHMLFAELGRNSGAHEFMREEFKHFKELFIDDDDLVTMAFLATCQDNTPAKTGTVEASPVHQDPQGSFGTLLFREVTKRLEDPERANSNEVRADLLVCRALLQLQVDKTAPAAIEDLFEAGKIYEQLYKDGDADYWRHVRRALKADKPEDLGRDIQKMDRDDLLSLFQMALMFPRAPIGRIAEPTGPRGFRRKGSKPHVLFSLRRWGSAAATFDSTKTMLKNFGGGFFLYGGPGKGIVVDPGRDFVNLFRTRSPFNINDITHIAVTHEHEDHSADVDRLFTIFWEMWKPLKHHLTPDDPGSNRLTLLIGPQVEGLATRLYWEYAACQKPNGRRDDATALRDLVEKCRKQFNLNDEEKLPCERFSEDELRFCPKRRPYLRSVKRIIPPEWRAHDQLSNVGEDILCACSPMYSEDGLNITALPAQHEPHPVYGKQDGIYFAVGFKIRFTWPDGTERTIVFSGDTGLPDVKDTDRCNHYIQSLSAEGKTNILVLNLSSISPAELRQTDYSRGGHLGFRGIETILNDDSADYQIALINELFHDVSRFDWRHRLAEHLQKQFNDNNEDRKVIVGDMGMYFDLLDLNCACSPYCGEGEIKRLGYVPAQNILGQCKAYDPLDRAAPLSLLCKECVRPV